MNEPQWKFVNDEKTLVWRSWPNGKQESCSINALEVQEYLAAGHQILPKDS